jgi:hypothetical protein
MIIEGSDDKYIKGTPEYEAWCEGREAYMECGDEDGAIADSPYRFQPHQAKLHQAFSDGVKDEKIWSLDSTGR